MRRVGLLAVLALAAECAWGQAGAPALNPPAQAHAAEQKAAQVTVYLPRRPVVAPRLLRHAFSSDFPKVCVDRVSGESDLSLLIDTAGRARNVMFLKPSGTVADRFAILVASRDRFAPGTFHGKPVVVAESLQIKLEACIGLRRDAAGKLVSDWLLKSPPRQKLKQPKNPPQVAELAPLETPRAELARKITRPDFFGNGESAPVLLSSGYANYTPSHPGAKGTCEVSLVVDEHGLPQDLHVLKKLDPGLDRSAISAVQEYRFFPAIKNDQPVPAAVVVNVDFAPPRR